MLRTRDNAAVTHTAGNRGGQTAGNIGLGADDARSLTAREVRAAEIDIRAVHNVVAILTAKRSGQTAERVGIFLVLPSRRKRDRLRNKMPGIAALGIAHDKDRIIGGSKHTFHNLLTLRECQSDIHTAKLMLTDQLQGVLHILITVDRKRGAQHHSDFLFHRKL